VYAVLEGRDKEIGRGGNFDPKSRILNAAHSVTGPWWKLMAGAIVGVPKMMYVR